MSHRPPGTPGHAPESTGNEEPKRQTWNEAFLEAAAGGSLTEEMAREWLEGAALEEALRLIARHRCPDTGRIRCDCRCCIDRLEAEAAYWEGRSRGDTP